jgi:hypothetical protein
MSVCRSMSSVIIAQITFIKRSIVNINLRLRAELMTHKKPKNVEMNSNNLKP